MLMIVARYRNHSRQDEHRGVKTHPIAYSTDWHNRSHHIGVPFVSAIHIPDLLIIASSGNR
eukprot:6214591-Pleurochrysis_carterae.AAC.3